MINALKNSILWRMLVFVADSAKHSIFGRFARKIAEWYSFSALRRKIEAFLSRDCFDYFSALSKLLDFWGSTIENFCSFCGRLWQESTLKKVCAALSEWIKSSFLLGWAYRVGFRRFAIIALALYALIDYVLRNILKISILAGGWDEGLFILLAVYAFVLRGSSPQIYGRRRSCLGEYIILFVCVGFFLMCAVSPKMSIALDGFRAVVQYMLWFFILLRIMRDRNDFMLFYYVFTALSLAMCFHGIYQFIIAAPIPSSWVTSTESAVRTRVFSITGSPNIFGSFIVMTAPLAAGLMYYFKKVSHKFLAMCAVGIMCVTVLFTFSRGAWFGAVIAVIIFAFLVDRRLIALLLGGGAAALFIPSIASRITFLFTPEFRTASLAGGRMIRWKAGMDILSSGNELLGFGLGRFGGAVAMQNQVLEDVAGYDYFYLDNYYLKTLVEMGYLGIFFFALLIIGFCVWSLRSIYRTRKTSDYPLVCGIFAGLCGVLVHCFFENIFEVPYMQAYFWILAALIVFRGYFCKESLILQNSE